MQIGSVLPPITEEEREQFNAGPEESQPRNTCVAYATFSPTHWHTETYHIYSPGEGLPIVLTSP